MIAIDKVLTWAQRLQISCFGSPICITIEAGQGVSANKLIHISASAGADTKHYIVSSEMPTAEIYQAWGTIKDDVNKLRDQYIGHRVNKHGRVINDNIAQLAP